MGKNKKYEVTQIHIESAAFDILIMEIPEDEIEDKLTYLSREKGLIKKSLYDDFIIATCVANINDFLTHLNQRGTNLKKLNEIRSEIVENIIAINRFLDPNVLVLNKNKVVKIGTSDDTDVTKLIDNEFWNKDTYKETEQQILHNQDVKKSLDLSKIKSLKDLEYTPVQKFWKRLGQYVTIKQFPEESVDIILGGREFTTRTAFEQYVVTICIEEIEDLFLRLDSLGIPNRVSPPILVHELYELCKASNPFLDFGNYKGEEMDEMDPFATMHRTASEGEESESMPTRKTKLFKQVKKEDLLGLGNTIKKRVVGQDDAVDNLVDAIQRSSVGLKDPNHPLGSFIFAGYSGCGKTYTAKILAESLIGSPRGLVNIDCSEYASDHEYAKLIGAPAGYIGHEAGGYLTNAIRKNPFSVVLFDEIEKASDKVHQLLLQVMEEARLTDGKGHAVSFKDAIIIMTSNIGVKEVSDISKTIGFGSVSTITDEKRSQAIEKALKKQFKPEFLNRLTAIINFSTLTKEHYLDIIKLELEKLKVNLKLSGTEFSQIILNFEDSLLNYIYDLGIDDKYGARPLKRAIENEISTPLARKLLNDNVTGQASATLSVKKKKLVIDIREEDDVVNPPFYMEIGSNNE
jgi:ATP-dependent Clp protease ATP-binding subunit ClpC